jgi:hypothetical protein
VPVAAVLEAIIVYEFVAVFEFATIFELAAVLVQAGRPISYASRTLNKAQHNYSVTEKECLCVSWALRYFHCYVHGAALTIYTDHDALNRILGRIARWIMDIWTYDFIVAHRKGVDHQDADALSRIVVGNGNEKLKKITVKVVNSQAIVNNGDIQPIGISGNSIYEEGSELSRFKCTATYGELPKSQKKDPQIQKIYAKGRENEYPFMCKNGI